MCSVSNPMLMAASRQGDIHLAHIARHSTCLTCGLMALPEGRGGRRGEEVEGRAEMGEERVRERVEREERG